MGRIQRLAVPDAGETVKFSQDLPPHQHIRSTFRESMMTFTLEDLDAMAEEVDKRGFRARFLDPMADDAHEYRYLPSLDKDGVPEDGTTDLLAKVSKVATVRKWTDVCIVGPGLEPLTGNHVAHVAPARNGTIDNSHLTPEQILATARTNIPASERGRSVFDVFDQEDPFDATCEKVAQREKVSLARLRRLAISEGCDELENLEQALTDMARVIRGG